jgi:hypothetical protein
MGQIVTSGTTFFVSSGTPDSGDTVLGGGIVLLHLHARPRRQRCSY